MPLVYYMPPIDSGDLPGPESQTEARALGRDIKFDGENFGYTADGDYLMVEGPPALRQAVYNCLITTPGDYKLRPQYGVGIERFVGRPLTTANKEEIKELLRRNLLQMRRIEQVAQIAVEVGAENNSLFIHLTIRAAGRVVRFSPFEFRRP